MKTIDGNLGSKDYPRLGYGLFAFVIGKAKCPRTMANSLAHHQDNGGRSTLDLIVYYAFSEFYRFLEALQVLLLC